MSSPTIADMPSIVAAHGLVPVMLSTDPDRLTITADDLLRAITPATRAVVLAPLLGCRMADDEAATAARRRGLLVVEDAAQAFCGLDYAGHAASDVTMFSFGPIKTATALGGGVLRVRDGELRRRMQAIQRAYPRQSRWAYARRVLKYAAYRGLATPICYRGLMRALEWFGRDGDAVASQLARSFAATDLTGQLRRRPCGGLLRLLARRLRRFDQTAAARIDRRRRHGNRLAQAASSVAGVPGLKNPTHSHWVTAVTADRPEQAARQLRRAGFDATTRSSLRGVDAGLANGSRPWLGRLLFLPDLVDMSADEVERLERALCDALAATGEGSDAGAKARHRDDAP
jgi:dTDP-4-amino-4,6-dideoxygalactose transaminase